MRNEADEKRVNEEVKNNDNNELENEDEGVDNNNESETKNRWDALYKLSKVKREKLEEERKRIQIEREKEDFKHCTFTPKLNSLYKSTRRKNNNFQLNPDNVDKDKDNDDSLNKDKDKDKDNDQDKKEEQKQDPVDLKESNLLDRQEIWMQRKQMKIEQMKEDQANRDMEAVDFTPSLNSPDSIEKINLTQRVEVIVEDPESYLSYLKRMEKKRKRKNDLVNKQRLTPGSGNVWKRKQLEKQKQYNQYDYKNHEYMKTIGNKTLTSTLSAKDTIINKNTISSISSSLKVNQKQKVSSSFHNGDQDRIGMNAITINNPIKYGDAINQLHRKLFAIKLITD